MTEIITRLADVSPRYDALFCDLWGCVHDGHHVFAEAVAALRAFRERRGIVLLLTNSPRPKAAVMAQLRDLGMPDDAWDEIATSGDAAQNALISGAVGRRVLHIGAPKDESFFDELAPDLAEAAAKLPPIKRVPLDEAEGIVCTGLADTPDASPADYRGTLLAAKQRRLPMLCVNPDIVVDHGGRRLWCAGALARDYAEMGGRVFYFGKPHPPIYDLARRRLAALQKIEDAGILCIGDGIATDIQGAMGEGLDALFITAGIDAAAFGPDRNRPDPQALDAWLDERRITPLFAMPRLA